MGIIPNLSDELNLYIDNYKRLTKKHPQAIPASPKEYSTIIGLIVKYMEEHPQDDSIYYECGVNENSTIIVWKGSDVYIHNNAEQIRNAIKI